MDVSYNPHAERARRKNRSTPNVNYLSLAPLTSRLPLNDDELLDDSSLPPNISYLQGKSPPTTPRLLASSARTPRSRSISRTRPPSGPAGPIPKSKSSTHLPGGQHARQTRRAVSGTTTPRAPKPSTDDAGADGDWLLRTGALMTCEAREAKGQSWLVSRQSSTSLVGTRDAEEEAFELDLRRERELASRGASRRGSVADDGVPLLPLLGSGVPSRRQSRSHSLVQGRSQHSPAGDPVAPDFVDLDEKLEELERDSLEADEADVRRLMRRGGQKNGSWIASMIGWSLFSVLEHEEDSEESEDEGPDDGDDEDGHSRHERSAWLKRHCEGPLDPEDLIPPPENNQGGWSDAAWLLSVATKVIF